jgi:molybdopterin/thiamine biosynthesis adenylyltransferase
LVGSMITVDLRVPADVHDAMMKDVTQATEWAGYLLCGTLNEDDRWTLLGREWCPVPDHQRIAGTVHGMTWDPDFDISMLNRAQRENVACVVVHHHGGKSPGLSQTDKKTRDSLMPFLASGAPATPHVFAVLGDRALHGDAYLQGSATGTVDRMRVSGSWLDDWGDSELPALGSFEAQRHDRSIRAFGAHGQARLKGARVGVIGCGGGGAHVIQQLSYLGIGNFVLVDGDDVDETNLNRLVGAFPAPRLGWLRRLIRRGSSDVGAPKVDVMTRLIRRVNDQATVASFKAWFPSEETVAALRTCDVLVACVDKLRVRDDLNRFAKRFLIPMVDVGLQIHAENTAKGRRFAMPGRVSKVLAHGPCLRCQGIVDDQKLTAERGGLAPGYTGPAGTPDPAVVTLNGIVASIAATEVLQLFTGFAGVAGPNGGWIYDGVDGTVQKVHKDVVGCPACLSERGAGQVL